MTTKHDRVSPARRAAFDILRRVEDGAFASALIAALPRSGLSPEDRGLVQEIVLGVLRWRATLDYFIERHSSRPLSRMDPPVVVALRIGTYQLKFLDRIPDAAAVNESVGLVRQARLSSATGMVNAVLRNIARNRDETPGEDLSDPLEKAAVTTSHPRWMLERWASWLGQDEAIRLAAANNQIPHVAFRVNTAKAGITEALDSLHSEGVVTQPSTLVPGAFIVERGSAIVATRAFEEGLIYLQDVASQLVSVILDPQPGNRVLDLCAAPGSKSTHMAAMSGDEATIIACDIHPHRLATLSASCRRLGINSIAPVALDAGMQLPFAPDTPLFDRVLVDAPCSGTGTLRENPEIKWRLEAGHISELADVQLSLLQNAARMVAGNGRLVYSTCSMEPEEDEAVIKRFLESGAPFKVVRPAASPDLITRDGFARTFPHLHGTDGFFAAVMERTA